MSDERQFIETLFNQRLNFYIITYSLVITGTLAAKEDDDRILCSFNRSLSLFFAWTISIQGVPQIATNLEGAPSDEATSCQT